MLLSRLKACFRGSYSLNYPLVPRLTQHQRAGRIGGPRSAAKAMAAVAQRYEEMARAKGTLREVAKLYGVSHEIVRRARERFPQQESAA